MEVAQLRALRELRDRGSIAAVAASMGVTPSSVSQQLSALQRSAGTNLTRRMGRRTVLTDAGNALAQAAVGVEAALARAHAAVASFGAAHSAVTVSAFHSAAIALFPPLLAHLHDDGLEIVLHDEDVSTEAFPELTMTHDLVIAHRMVGSAPWPTTVISTNLFSEPLDIAFRVGHRLEGLSCVGPADLRDESWIAVHEGFPLDQAVRRVAGAAGRDPRIAHRVNDFEVATSMLRASDHIALLPRTTSRAVGVHLVPLAGEFGLARRIDVLSRPETIQRYGVREVVERLQQCTSSLAVGKGVVAASAGSSPSLAGPE